MAQEKHRLVIPADGGENAGANNPLARSVQAIDDATGVNSDIIAATEAKQEAIQEQQRQSEVTSSGWFNVDMTKLAAHGKLYPDDMQIMYRACRAGEIRHWSNLDDNANLLEAAQYLTDIISVCVKCVSKSGNYAYSHKDIYEHDKWYLIMLIHEVTFPENSELANPIKLEVSSGTCKHTFTLDLGSEHLHFIEPDEMMDKYIDSERGVYDVATKSYGSFVCKPPTIGVATAFTEYMKTLDKDTVLNAKAIIVAAQWLAIDWRGLNNKKVEALCQQFQQMDAFKELQVKMGILKKCHISAADTIKFVCPHCHMEGEAPFRFPNGIKQIFQPVQNIESELL